MTLRSDFDAPFGAFEFEQSDGSVVNELRAYGFCDEIRESGVAHRVVLFNLDDIEKIAAALSLNGYCIMRPFPVNANVYLIGFYLANSRDRRSEVVLKRIAGKPGRDVYQSIVAQSGEQRLLVSKRIQIDNAGRRIRYFCGGEVLIGTQVEIGDHVEPVDSRPRRSDDPHFAGACG